MTEGALSRISSVCLAGFIVVAWTLAGVAAADATSSRAELQRQIEERGRFSPEQVRAVMALLDRAERGRLPEQVLVNRIREGVARRADPATILKVAEDWLGRLGAADAFARRAAAKGIRDAEHERALQVLAEALARDLSPKDLDPLLTPAAKAGLDLSGLSRVAETVADLAHRGVAVEDVREVVAAGLSRGMPIARVEKSAALLLEADFLRLSPSEARQIVLEGIRDGHGETVILEDLKEAAERSRAGGEGRGRGRGGRGRSDEKRPSDEEKDERRGRDERDRRRP